MTKDMAATEVQSSISSTGLDDQQHVIGDDEAQTMVLVGRGRGGWITFPFVTVGILGLTIAASGWLSNLIVFLMGQFNIKSIDAAQIYNIVNGCTNFLPIAGAILADSSFGNFSVVNVSSFISLMGMILLTLTASIRSLRPQHCVNESMMNTSPCESPSTFQYAVLYIAITLASLGIGGTRFTIATMGADQFDKPKHQSSFFNWYFFTLYVAYVIGSTVLVYIQDNVGWNWGLGLSLAANAIGIAVFLAGKRYYRYFKPSGSPFTRIARVVVASIQKRKVPLSSEAKAYYYGYNNGAVIQPSSSPTSSLRFLNRAAIKTDGDTNEDGSMAKPWRLCTVQQVEDLKTLLRIFPLWSTGIFLSIPIGIQSSLVVLQALTMDRSIGPHFKVPAGSFLVSTLIATAIFLTFIDRFLLPMYKKLTGRSLTPLQRVGVGHILNIVGMATSAIVESRRLHVVRSHNLEGTGIIVPMSALWLVGPLAIVGIGEAFHFPGQVSLYYQEFPTSLRSTSTAMISMLVALGYYLSSALIDVVRRVTAWLPDDIDEGRLDNVFWLLVVIGLINFGYYITCSVLYKYQNADEESSVKGSESINKG